MYRNGTPLPAVTQPGTTVSGLQCGTAYTLEVDAVDAAKNRSSRAAVTASTAACPDTQAPTAPTNLTATTRTATSIALTWSTSTDAVGVVGYGLYLGGQPVGTANGTTGIFSDLTCNTGYTLSVDAYDAAGNRSAKTTVMVATTACPPPPAPTVTMGESSILSVNDSGNGNLLVSQKATLAQTGILRRLSFYVTTAAGNLRLGVYTPNGPSGGPGQKLAETASFTPTAGWNTVNVLSPVTLGAGSYWLAYLPSSSSLGFRAGERRRGALAELLVRPHAGDVPHLDDDRGRPLVALRHAGRDQRGSASAASAASACRPVRRRRGQRRGRHGRPQRPRLLQRSRQRRDEPDAGAAAGAGADAALRRLPAASRTPRTQGPPGR